MNPKKLIVLSILAILHAGCGEPTDTDASSGNESANISGSEDSDEESLATDPTSGEEPLETSGDEPDDTLGAEPADCAPLDRDQCLATDGCRAISGHRVLVDESGFCAPLELFVRCAENLACDEAIGYALSPDGEWWMFPDLCTPDGWPVEYSNPEP
ncbi:MAG: hypothetical protein FWD57_03935, partial [Polyangiaceae bacterium]|nr:hypothetical protein [Polyangiaceae bacterium]